MRMWLQFFMKVLSRCWNFYTQWQKDWSLALGAVYKFPIILHHYEIYFSRDQTLIAIEYCKIVRLGLKIT